MKRILVVMAVLAVAAVAGAIVFQAAARERDYRQLLAEGDAALADGQLLAAVEDYSGAVLLRPDSMLARLRRGETYRERGDLDAAARDFRDAAALDPTATRPLEQWGDALYEQQRYRRAAEVYSARLRLDDRSAVTQYKVGLANYRDGNPDAALSALEQAVRLDDQVGDAYYLMGVCFKETHQTDKAVRALETAVARSPGSIPAREELAELYASLGQRGKELEQLQVLAGLDGQHVERRIAVGLAHGRAGHTDLAVLTLASALDQTPEQPLVYAALGRVWLDVALSQGGRRDALGKALEALERAASSPTATSEVKTLYGRALLRDHQLDAAERVLQQATERFPVDPTAFADYAAAAQGLRHLEVERTALVTYNSLVGDDSNFPSRAFRIGSLSLTLKDPAAAVTWLERASAAAPNDGRTLSALADAHLQAGDRDQAREAVTRGLQADPTNAHLRALARRLSSN